MEPFGTSPPQVLTLKKKTRTKTNHQTKKNPPRTFPKEVMKVLFSLFSICWKYITAVDQQEIKHFVRKQWKQTKRTQLMKHKVRLRLASFWLERRSQHRQQSHDGVRISVADEPILPCLNLEAADEIPNHRKFLHPQRQTTTDERLENGGAGWNVALRSKRWHQKQDPEQIIPEKTPPQQDFSNQRAHGARCPMGWASSCFYCVPGT